MMIDNDNDMLLKSEKIDLSDSLFVCKLVIDDIFYCLKSSLWCSVFTYCGLVFSTCTR